LTSAHISQRNLVSRPFGTSSKPDRHQVTGLPSERSIIVDLQ